MAQTAGGQVVSTRRAATQSGDVEYVEFGDPQAPVLLFVHGVLANGRIWQAVACLLAENHRCIVPAWPLGAHTLPMHADADLSPTGMLTVITQFMDALALEHATFIGNDSGGALCQMMVAYHPQRVSRLVLTSCDAYGVWLPLAFKYLEWAAYVPGMLWVLAQSMRLRWLRRLPIAFGWLSKRMPPDISDALASPLARSAGVRRDAGKFLRGISPKLTQSAARHFGAFAAPVLIAWSREDRFFSPSLAQRLQQDFSHAQLAWITDAYTFSAIDNPVQLAAAIAEFLAGRSGVQAAAPASNRKIT
ncbi:MAG: alpha/beta hydrolase [Pseudomonadota bacterium]